jgi:hypothetical protein
MTKIKTSLAFKMTLLIGELLKKISPGEAAMVVLSIMHVLMELGAYDVYSDGVNQNIADEKSKASPDVNEIKRLEMLREELDAVLDLGKLLQSHATAGKELFKKAEKDQGLTEGVFAPPSFPEFSS